MQEGQIIHGRYKVQKSLGRGSFGQVVSAIDTQQTNPDGTERKVAIKVVKSKEAFRRQAKTEIKLLELLNKMDPDDQWCIVRFYEQFDFSGHTCLVFEHLSFNLYELLRRTSFRGVSLNLIRKFARQILKTLAFLSLPDIDVIHCDLKPENILFRQPTRSAIKVIDFGSSCRRDQQVYVYIQSRFYRSPEVILGLGYTQAIDMWSLGCILVEMHTGVPLFAGRDESDQMRRFVTLKGLPPRAMLEKGKKTKHFFDVRPAEAATPSDVSGRLAKLREQRAKEGKAPALPPGAGAAAEGGSSSSAAAGSASSSTSATATAPSSGAGDSGNKEGDSKVRRSAAELEALLGEESDDEWPAAGLPPGSLGGSGGGGSGAAQSGSAPMSDSEPPETSDGTEASAGSVMVVPYSTGKCSTAASEASTAEQREQQQRLMERRARFRKEHLGKQPLPSVYSVKPRSKPPSSREPKVFTDLRTVLGVHTKGPSGRRADEATGHTERDYALFLDLIERMLEWDPAVRIRPMQALNHPFLREDIEAIHKADKGAVGGEGGGAASGSGAGDAGGGSQAQGGGSGT